MDRSEVKIAKLVEKFAHHAAEQTDAIFRGDAGTGNKHARQLNAAFDKLCTHGNAGRDALTILFGHPRMDVRVKAAAFLLRHRTEEAKTVLLEAASGEGLAAFGTWSLDVD